MNPTLYKMDSRGNTRIWRMEQDGPRFRTISGLKDGKQVTTDWTVAERKNVGKTNATTAEEQAGLEIEAQYRLKLRKDYHKSVEDIVTQKFFKPMLAKDYTKHKDRIDWATNVYAQPKLDGIRCIATKDGLWSRTGKPIEAVPHLNNALAPLFAADPALVLDGELYNHELRDNFNEIVSIVRKHKPDHNELARAELIEYHIYDAPSVDDSFGVRLKAITKLKDVDGVVVVRTEKVSSEADADELYGQQVEQGYEGGIIRLDGPYEQKRSSLLLKRKDFEDAEFEIVRVEEGLGNWSGAAKRIIFRLEDGRECGAGLRGTKEYAQDVLENANKYIGKQVTVQFFTRTPDGMPRFPIAKHLHIDKRW